MNINEPIGLKVAFVTQARTLQRKIKRRALLDVTFKFETKRIAIVGKHGRLDIKTLQFRPIGIYNEVFVLELLLLKKLLL